MKRTLLLIFFLGLLTGGAFAQAPPPPPPPLIYSAPEASIVKAFSDDEHKFKVSFPGVPEKRTTVGEKVTEFVYKVSRKGSNSVVTVLVFPISMEPHAQQLLVSYKEDLPKLTAKAPFRDPAKVSNITFEREIEVTGIKGKEFGYESDYHFTRTAVFVIGNHFFEVKTDVTNWHILKKHHPELVEAFNAEAERFQKSFVFLK